MNSLLPLRCLFLAVVLLAAVCHAQSLRFEPGTRPIEWNVWDSSNQVLTSSFDPAKFKPFVRDSVPPRAKTCSGTRLTIISIITP